MLDKKLDSTVKPKDKSAASLEKEDNSPKLVNKLLMEIFHHDEVADREKNATIYMEQFKSILEKHDDDTKS